MNGMILSIFQSSEVFFEKPVSKIVAEGPQGSFCILPRHIDLATALVTGILMYHTDSGQEAFAALKGGILVKQGENIFIATQMVIEGELGELRQAVEKMLTEVDERERKARSATARLEADFIRRMVEFGKNA